MFFCLVAVLALAATAWPGIVLAENPPLQASLQHGPVSSTLAGRSIPVSVGVGDPEEILEVRLYFKTMAAGDYLFLTMTGSSKGEFSAELPPARNDTKGIDYLLLFKNSRGEVRKTKPFRLLVLNDYTAPPPSPDEFEVFSESGTGEMENRDFATTLQLTVSPEPLLDYAAEDPYLPQTDPDPRTKGSFLGGLTELGGFSFSLRIGGVGFFYRGFSGR